MKWWLGFTIAVSLGVPGSAQVLSRRPAGPSERKNPVPADAPPITVPLSLPAGTPLKVALDEDVRVHRVGQPVRGHVVEPVYAFEKLVIPAGTAAKGEISQLSPVSKQARTLAAMNANFSPTRQVRITFTELQLADGRRIPISTEVSPTSGGTLQFVSSSVKKTSRTDAARNAVSRRVAQAKQEVHKDIELAKSQIQEPGKVHRLERLGLAQLPYHPQFLDAGEKFTADLKQPLGFGEEMLTAQAVSAIGTLPAPGAVLHADLATPLSSATSKRGDRVEAVIMKPLFSSNQLIIPEGSRLQGTVVQVRPARRLSRNGLLRIEFQKIVPPNGIEEKITANLDAVEVAQKEHLTLDSEGGAQVTNPKTRYLSTGLSVALAASSASDEHDRDGDLRGGGGGGDGALAGASGFGLIGMACGAFAHSRIVSQAFGFYGAGMSVFSHFLARGRDVVYPKDMSMLVSLGASGAKRPALP